MIINALKNGDKFSSAFGHLLFDTLYLLNPLKSWSLSHTHRLGNAVADALAKRAKFSSPFTLWLEHVPPNVVNFVSVDVLAL